MKNQKLIIGLVIIMIVLFCTYLFMRNNCVLGTIYIPARDGGGFGGGFGGGKTEESYRSRFGDFKTQGEAVNYCMSKKFILEN